ncbi:MAG: phage antirepressor protein [Bacteroidota bacterium]|nr:phage antirepressor protein [Bacteroidota bacterium]
MYCWNTAGIFRLIQSIPSSKAEPFKRWLAKVGYERVQEIEDPELATKRTKALYQTKVTVLIGLKSECAALQSVKNLPTNGKNRGVKEQIEYSILTAEISNATFGMTPSEYKELKHLKRENLWILKIKYYFWNDMKKQVVNNNLVKLNTYGFSKLKQNAKDGGKIAGDAKKALEKKTDKQVSTNENYLEAPENKKRLK